MLSGKVCDLLADRDSILGREAIVHPSIDARLGDLVNRLREAAVGSHWLQQTWDSAIDRKVEFVGFEEGLQGCGDRAACTSVGRGVLRMIGSHGQGKPGGVRCGRWIAVSIASRNRCDWTPEVIVIFGIPAGNRRIGTRGREQRKEPGILFQREPGGS